MDGIFLTDRGLVRTHNEDNGNLLMHDHSGYRFAFVADGMGGHQAGDVASQIARDFLTEKWEKCNFEADESELKTWLQKAIRELNAAIYQRSINNKSLAGMGTTVIAVISTSDSFVYANVGDSRVYSISDNSVEQLSEDHSLVTELVKSGQIDESEAEHHPRKNWVTRSVGTEPTVKIDLDSFDWNNKDYLLLCSDGLSNKLSKEDIKNVFKTKETLQSKAEKLISLANERGGEDNITVAILQRPGKDVKKE